MTSMLHVTMYSKHVTHTVFEPWSCWLLLLLLLLFMALNSCPQAQKAQRLHDEKVAMAKTLAENDANIKAKKQAAKQQVGPSILHDLVAQLQQAKNPPACKASQVLHQTSWLA